MLLSRPFVLLSLLVLASAPITAQGIRDCGGTALGTYRWVASGQLTRANNCQCSFGCATGFRCYPVQSQGSSVEKTNPACNPTAGSCAVRIHATATIPGLADMVAQNGLFSSTTPWAEWYPCTGAACAKDIVCGLDAFGGRINFDNLDTWLQRGLSCAQALTLNLSVKIRVCAASSCELGTVIDLPSAFLADSLGCPPVPPPLVNDCNTCGGCVPGGGGCSIPVEGGLFCAPSKDGPGAHLRYRAGAAGGPGYPGTAAWRTALGLYWSHDYAQRIVPSPDFSHVYLITERASFREFSNLASGSGLRLYQTNAPSDEYRKLYYDTATGGWQLDSLDGRKDFFRADGRWQETILSQNPTHPTLATYNGGNQLVSVSFPDQRSESFAYYTNGKLASITEVPVAGSGTASRVWTYVWNGDELASIGRPDGTKWAFTYDPAKNGGRPGYLTQVRLIGTDGVTSRVEAAFEYDASGNVVKSWKGDPSYTGANAASRQELTYTNATFPMRTDVKEWIDATHSETTSYEFDRDPRSIKARINKITGDCPVCGTGPNSQFTYADAANPLLPTQVIDGRGLTTQYSYNANGRMTSKTEAAATSLARTTTWQYGNAGFPGLPTRNEMPSTSGGSAQRVRILSYDGSGNLATRTIQGAEAGSSFTFDTVSTFNGAGQPLSVDPPGYGTADQTTYTYDSATGGLLPSSRIDPLIGATTFGYDGLNRRTSVTDPNGVQTLTGFDNLSRVTAVTQKGATTADDLVTTYQYTLVGDLFRTILPRGNLFEYGYDGAGRLISIERRPDAATHGERTFYTLDTFGHRTKEELQHWNGSAWVTDSFTDFVYSSRCHLDKAVNADGTATEYAYDCDNNLEKLWDANHPRVTNPTPTQLYAYDSLNRLTSVTQAWTGAGGGTATTTYTYDVQDHLASVTDAEGNPTTYTTSDRDLMTQEVSLVTGTTTNAYNEHGQRVEETDARGVTASRSYDALDRLTFLDYPDDSLDTTYTYDAPSVPFSKGRLTSIDRGETSIAYTHDRFGRMLQDGAVTNSYDKNGNSATLAYPNGVVATYTYDFADRQSTLQMHDGANPTQPLVSASSYKPFGPLSSLTLGNGLTETHGYSTRYLPTSISVPSLLSWSYTTDNVGNPTAIADTLNSANNRTYAYQDSQYFLATGNGPWGNRSWTYDKIGNRLTETNDFGTDTFSYVTNGTGGNTPLVDGYAYDEAGDLLFGNVSLTYGDDRRVSGNGWKFGFTAAYDGRGFLSQFLGHQQQQAQRDGTLPTYSSDGLLLHREALYAAPFGVGGGTSELYIFYFAGRPVATLENLTTTTSTSTLQLLTTDHLGTPILITNASGSQVWQGGFEPFGTDFSSAPTPLRFPGQWIDSILSEEIGLYYNVNRWYEPQTGRYSQPDPFDDVDYAYALSNPERFVDPTGEFPWPTWPPEEPWHPEEGVKTACRPGDDCATLLRKMLVLLRMIDTHQNWDWNMPRPRGGNRHRKDINQLWKQLADCQEQFLDECSDPIGKCSRRIVRGLTYMADDAIRSMAEHSRSTGPVPPPPPWIWIFAP